MSDEKELPNFVKHIFHTPKISPLQEISWRKEFHLKKFIQELSDIDTPKLTMSRRKELFLHCQDLKFIFLDIGLIASRINENVPKINRFEELWNTTHTRKLTPLEVKELENLENVVDVFNLAVRTLLVFVVIFMDKFARLARLTIDVKVSINSRKIYRILQE